MPVESPMLIATSKPSPKRPANKIGISSPIASTVDKAIDKSDSHVASSNNTDYNPTWVNSNAPLPTLQIPNQVKQNSVASVYENILALQQMQNRHSFAQQQVNMMQMVGQYQLLLQQQQQGESSALIEAIIKAIPNNK